MSADDVARNELAKKFKRVGPVCGGTFAVFDGSHEFHVDAKGTPLYKERYAYVGSFVGDFAWVRTNGKNAREFHIRRDGTRLYKNDFRTVGDFDGGNCARASHVEGIEFFINVKGERIRPDE